MSSEESYLSIVLNTTSGGPGHLSPLQASIREENQKQLSQLQEVLSSSSPRRQNFEGSYSELASRVPSKILDNLKKKPLKKCRILLKRRLEDRLPEEYRHFTIMNEPDSVIKSIVYSDIWPRSEWPKYRVWKHKSFTKSCVKELLSSFNLLLLWLYTDLIDWYFTYATPQDLKKFLGLRELEDSQKRVFHYYFSQIVPEECGGVFLI